MTTARRRKHSAGPPGLPPGTLQVDPAAPEPVLHFFGYGPEGLDEGAVDDLSEVAGLRDRWRVLWLNVNGLGDTEVIEHLGEVFGLHRLALEDVLNTFQRPKVDTYPELVFVVMRMLRWVETGIDLHDEQFALFLGQGFVITFQEQRGDPFDMVRHRLREGGTRLRSKESDYLAYTLIDAIVDSYFPLLQAFGDHLDDLEEEIIDRPTRQTLGTVRRARRVLIHSRRAVWPARDVGHSLQNEALPFFTDDTRVYLRDLYDHSLRVVDLLESYRDEVSGMVEAYMSTVSFRMNEVMSTLTVVGTIFLPLTFIVGVYGMNFDTSSPWNMPELSWRYGYPAVMLFMLVTGLVMLALFWRRGWLASDYLAPDDEA